MLSKVKYFHKATQGKVLKILTPKQMLQGMPIALVPSKTSTT